MLQPRLGLGTLPQHGLIKLPEAPGLIPSNCHGAEDTASCTRSPKSNIAGLGGGAAQRNAVLETCLQRGTLCFPDTLGKPAWVGGASPPNPFFAVLILGSTEGKDRHLPSMRQKPGGGWGDWERCECAFVGHPLREAAVCLGGNYRLSKRKQNRTEAPLAYWHGQGQQNRKQQVLGQDVQRVRTLWSGSEFGNGTTSAGGSQKSKTDWACLACIRPWVPAQPTSQARWSMSVISVLGR